MKEGVGGRRVVTGKIKLFGVGVKVPLFRYIQKFQRVFNLPPAFCADRQILRRRSWGIDVEASAYVGTMSDWNVHRNVKPDVSVKWQRQLATDPERTLMGCDNFQ